MANFWGAAVQAVLDPPKRYVTVGSAAPSVIPVVPVKGSPHAAPYAGVADSG